MDVSNNSINIRTDSFSAYLDVAPSKDQETDVFQAKKYSNMVFDNDTQQEDHVRKNRVSKKQSIFSRFSCKGHCSDSESVKVSEPAQVKRMVTTHIAGMNQNKMRSSSSIPDRTEEDKEEQFQFPVLSSGEEPRDSIEAFGPAAARKVKMVTWDAIPEAKKSLVSVRTDSGREYETESYASSDLFEIDNMLGACNMSGRKDLPFNIHHDRSSSEKSGLLLVCKSQRDDPKPMKS